MNNLYKFYLFCLPLLILLILNSCAYDSLEDITISDCSDTLNLVYDDIQPIFKRNCYVCHGDIVANAGIKTNTYEDLKAAVKTGRLWGAINHFENYKPMPFGRDKLPECDIVRIGYWIEQGMQP